MKKQLNININYSVHSLEELQHVIKALDCKTGKININLDTLKSVHTNQSQTSIEDTQSVDEIRKIMLKNGYVDLGLPSGTLWKFSYDEKYIDYQTIQVTNRGTDTRIICVLQSIHVRSFC